MAVLKVKENGEWKEIQAIKGDKGDTGATGAKGDKGDKGDTGAAGYTPVKGVDYFTQQDIDSLDIPDFHYVTEPQSPLDAKLYLDEMKPGIYILNDSGYGVRVYASRSSASYRRITFDAIGHVFYITDNKLLKYCELDSSTSEIKMYTYRVESDTWQSPSTYTVLSASLLDAAQTITAKKTFTVLPESSVTPTTNNQLVNKSYVDNLIPDELSDLAEDTTHRTVTDTEKTTWNGKADYGFTGIIDGTSANPTDGASLSNGTYKADPSKLTSYINLPMEDGTTKKQSIQRGGIVIRTNGRLIILATQNLLYQYNTTQQYFYEAEPIVESYIRTAAADGQAYLGTTAPPNNKIVTDPIYLLDGEINTGTTGHVRIIFTTTDDLEETGFEWSLTLASGEDILFEDGAEPSFKESHTYMLEFYGSTCQVLDFTESTGYSKEDLLKQFMRQNSGQIYYPQLDGKPNLTIQSAAGDSTTRNVVTEYNDITLTSFHDVEYYGIPKFIPLDLTLYNTTSANNKLHPHDQLPNGEYWVTHQGRIYIDGTDDYTAMPHELIYKSTDELIIVGYYGCTYWAWDRTDQVYKGGFFTTYADVTDMLTEYQKIGTVSKSSTATGTISMTDKKWTRKTRTAGINSATIAFPNEETIDDGYQSRFTGLTSSSFTAFTIASRTYTIRFVGDDCSGGDLTAQQNKYYNIEAKADGFGGVLAIVHSYTPAS